MLLQNFESCNSLYRSFNGYSALTAVRAFTARGPKAILVLVL